MDHLRIDTMQFRVLETLFVEGQPEHPILRVILADLRTSLLLGLPFGHGLYVSQGLIPEYIGHNSFLVLRGANLRGTRLDAAELAEDLHRGGYLLRPFPSERLPQPPFPSYGGREIA